MYAFILNYWQEALFLSLTTSVGVALKYLFKRIKSLFIRQKDVEEGVLAILHDRLFQNCQHYLAMKYCDIDERCNLDFMFTRYEKLGGNGTCKDIYKRVRELPYSLSEVGLDVHTQ